KKIKILTQTQRYLLRSAISCVKPGGVFVYSSCTLAPEENEAVVDWLLKKENDAVDLEDVSISGLELHQGLTTWKKKQFDLRIEKTARILPSELMEGFFVAKIRKLRSTVDTLPIRV